MSGEPSLDVARILRERIGEEPELNDRFLNPMFGRVLKTIGFDRSWVGAEGPYLVDKEGDRYLDMLSGYGVFAVGRNNPAIRRQLERFLEAETANLPQMGVTLLAGVLGEQLLKRVPEELGAALFTNSGAESIEATIKLSRAATGRPRIVYMKGAFHGLTTGALSAMGSPEFRERFGPFLPGFTEVPFGDSEAFKRELSTGDVGAAIVEPIQGKGVNIPPDGYLAEIRRLCDEAGTLLAFDEVQTGLGRTGKFLALEHWGVVPDIVTLSKALSGGYVPIGAVLCKRDVHAAVFDRMERALAHGSTFGNNDLAAAAAIATLSEIDDAGLVERAEKQGKLLLELTEPLVEKYDVVKAVRGKGLMWAVEFQEPQGGAARRIWRAMESRQPGIFSQMIAVPLFREHRILTQVAGHHMNVLKILPPLVIGEDDLRMFASALDETIAAAERLPRAVTRFGLGMARRGFAARSA